MDIDDELYVCLGRGVYFILYKFILLSGKYKCSFRDVIDWPSNDHLHPQLGLSTV